MQSLLFFSRVAFICNVCFVLVWVMRYYPVLEEGRPSDAVSLVLILGILIATVLNIAVNLFILVFMLRRKPVLKHLPGWLIIANFLILLPQLILISR